jgi:hypothetical protein
VAAAPVIAAPQPPAQTVAPAQSVVVNGSFNSYLFGSGLTYNLNVDGMYVSGGLASSTMALASQSPFIYSNYVNQVPDGGTVTGATLNLNLLVGSMVTGMTSLSGTPFFVPQLQAWLNSLSVKIQAGTVTHTISGLSLSSYDLFANGFGSQIAAGAPVSITVTGMDYFQASDYVSPEIVYSGGGGAPSLNVLSSARVESLVFTDTRTLTGSSLTNYLTLYYTTPVAPTGSLTTNAPDVESLVPVQVEEAPEPAEVTLLGSGLALIAFLRLRRRG